MARFLGFLSGALSIALTLAAVHAQDLLGAAPGTKVKGVATLGTKQIPLPAGEWEIVFAESDTLWNYSGVPMESENLFLVQKVGGKDRAYIFARTNLQVGGNGWYRRRGCDRNNVHHNESDSNYNIDDADCWILGHLLLTRAPARAAFFKRPRAHIRQNVGTSTMVLNWYWKNDASDYLWVGHYVNPTAYGFPVLRERRWIDSEWHPEAVSDAPRRRKFIETMKTFGARYREAVRAGFRNKLGAGDPALELVFKE